MSRDGGRTRACSRAASGTHPGRDRGAERLAEERAERHGLPGLDVPGRPVVDQAHAEDVLGEPARPGPARPAMLSTPTTKPSSASKSSRADGPNTGPSAPGRPGLAVRAAHRRAGHDHRPGPAVIADRQVPPVRGQRLAARPEDPADVAGVVLGRVEVDVVGDRERQVQRRLGRRAPAGPRAPRGTRRRLSQLVRAART